MPDEKINYKIGVVSDTHGLLRPDLIKKIAGVNLIIHAGDIGRAEIINSLEQIAPTFAIRGNVDIDESFSNLPFSRNFNLQNGSSVFVIHDLNDFFDQPVQNFRLVISGHSHKPKIHEKNGTIFLNPGSAGPRRFHLPVTFAIIEFDEGKIIPGIMELENY